MSPTPLASMNDLAADAAVVALVPGGSASLKLGKGKKAP